ncbi:MAG: hypothetical protein WAX89_00890 [Alphaproteobacteria bacterium]
MKLTFKLHEELLGLAFALEEQAKEHPFAVVVSGDAGFVLAMSDTPHSVGSRIVSSYLEGDTGENAYVLGPARSTEVLAKVETWLRNRLVDTTGLPHISLLLAAMGGFLSPHLRHHGTPLATVNYAGHA